MSKYLIFLSLVVFYCIAKPTQKAEICDYSDLYTIVDYTTYLIPFIDTTKFGGNPALHAYLNNLEQLIFEVKRKGMNE